MGDERLRDGRRETRDLRWCVWHGGGGWWVELNGYHISGGSCNAACNPLTHDDRNLKMKIP